MPILELLFQHKEFFVILLLLTFIAVGFGYIKILHAENGQLKANAAQLTTELQVSNQSITDLKNTITQQNAAVDKLKADADARQAAHAKEIAAAQKQADDWKQHAKEILFAKPDSTDACKAANDLINAEILHNVAK